MTRMRAAWFLVLALVAAMFRVGPASAEPYVAQCHIGKPSYCIKYAQMFCLRENTREDREQSCPAWERACFACHARIPECLKGSRPPMKSEACDKCSQEWRACMHEIDKKLWPNRRKPPRP